MIEWYKKVVFENYSNFSGRASRSEYWYFTLCNLLIIFSLVIIQVLCQTVFQDNIIGTVFGVLLALCTFAYYLGIIVPTIAVVVRRLHDVNKSGWFYFIALIPLIGGIWLLVLLFTSGDEGENDYGYDPKQNFEEIEAIGKIEA